MHGLHTGPQGRAQVRKAPREEQVELLSTNFGLSTKMKTELFSFCLACIVLPFFSFSPLLIRHGDPLEEARRAV
jgi:hypothetical protein